MDGPGVEDLACKDLAAKGLQLICAARGRVMTLILKLSVRSLSTRCRPVTPFFWLGDLCEMVCKPLKIDPPIYRRRVAFYTKDRSFDTSKIRRYLGFENVSSNLTGIIETVKWYRENSCLAE